MGNQCNGFSYTYSAKEQEEIKNIRKKYVPKEESALEQLRRLDKSVTGKATVVSLVIGILGTLVLGTGMCCVLVWADSLFVPGIIIGVLGIAIVSVNYPIYEKLVKKEHERIAPEIIRLTDELMK